MKRLDRYLMFFVCAGVALAVWVLGLGLDRWPFGQYSELPRFISLCVLVIGATLVFIVAWVKYYNKRSRVFLFAALAVTLLLGTSTSWATYKVVKWRGYIWMSDFLFEKRSPIDETKPLDVMFTFVDHFEPAGIWRSSEEFPVERRLSRMKRWEENYRRAIKGHQDSDGQSPKTSWIFPIGHSVPEVISELSRWPGRGWGEVEYHLHHRPDWDSQRVKEQIDRDVKALRGMGACTNGFAFVHGVYGLAAGDPRICKIVDELDLLEDAGCYADFTFPNLFTPAQPSQANSIFYAKTTDLPKPHDRGAPVTVGKNKADGLMLVQGPLWAGFTKVVLEDGNLSVDQPPHPDRIDRWLASHVHVKGKPNWVFIVVHTHSATEYAQDMLFQGNMQRTWTELEDRFKKGGNRLHYVTTRETFNIIKAAEAGKTGNPDQYRDFIVLPPDNLRSSSARTGRL